MLSLYHLFTHLLPNLAYCLFPGCELVKFTLSCAFHITVKTGGAYLELPFDLQLRRDLPFDLLVPAFHCHRLTVLILSIKLTVSINVFFLYIIYDAKGKRSGCRSCLHDKAVELGAAKHEEAAIYPVNQRIPNVSRSAGAASQRSNPQASVGGKRPFDPDIYL